MSLVFFLLVSLSPDSSGSESPAAERRIPTGRDPRRRGSGPHSSQSHGFLHLLLFLWRFVLLPAVNWVNKFPLGRMRLSLKEVRSRLWEGNRYWGKSSSALWTWRSCSDVTDLICILFSQQTAGGVVSVNAFVFVTLKLYWKVTARGSD